jgi:tRNA pseudouridine38-40 synthase
LSKKLARMVLVLEYEGTHYCGFQFQINGPTVQDEIEKALLKLTGEKIRVIAASRTDTGVHAKGQVVSFKTGAGLDTKTFINGLNYYLPQDIAVKASYQVNISFSVQRDAVSREYSYWIFNSSTRSPLISGRTYQVNTELNLEVMNQASQCLVGELDLASFVTGFSQSVIRSTLRRVYAAQVVKKADLVIFNIIAKSFLPHQVRNTVGTLLRVGLGKISIEDFKVIVEAKKPGLAGPTVPAQGLYLVKVNYPRLLGEYNEDL